MSLTSIYWSFEVSLEGRPLRLPKKFCSASHGGTIIPFTIIVLQFMLYKAFPCRSAITIIYLSSLVHISLQQNGKIFGLHEDRNINFSHAFFCMFSIICKPCSPCGARDPYAVDRGVLLCVLPRSPFNPHRHSHWMRGWKCVSLFWRHHKR